MFHFINKFNPIYTEKMYNNKSTIEEILYQEDIIFDIINNPNTNLIFFFLK